MSKNQVTQKHDLSQTGGQQLHTALLQTCASKTFDKVNGNRFLGRTSLEMTVLFLLIGMIKPVLKKSLRQNLAEQRTNRTSE